MKIYSILALTVLLVACDSNDNKEYVNDSILVTLDNGCVIHGVDYKRGRDFSRHIKYVLCPSSASPTLIYREGKIEKTVATVTDDQLIAAQRDLNAASEKLEAAKLEQAAAVKKLSELGANK